jgi:hypothetical protein
MTFFRSSLSHTYLPVLLVAVLVICCGQAYAQVTSLAGTQRQVAEQISWLPPAVAVLAYVIGTFFAATGLIKLKDWMSEPEKNPLQGVIIRLVVASLLIALPKILYLSNGTLFGQEANTGPTYVHVPMQNLKAF